MWEIPTDLHNTKFFDEPEEEFGVEYNDGENLYFVSKRRSNYYNET